MLRSTRLAQLFGGTLEGADSQDVGIDHLHSDSRDVGSGDGFVALCGEEMDGHDFVNAAAEAGARLAVVADSWVAGGRIPPLLLRVADPATALRAACSRRLDELGCPVIGITGSVGKTIAKEMVALALGDGAAKTPGNLNTWTQIPLAVLRLPEGTTSFVCEMGMSARGEIADLTSFTHPRVGLLLNVGFAHIGLLGSQRAIAEAKAELIEALPADGAAVLNADDPFVREVAARAAAPVAWFGMESAAAPWRLADVESDGLRGSTATLIGPDGTAPLTVQAPGRHLLIDACAAAATAAQLGVSTAQAAERLSGFEAPEHRGRVVAGFNGAAVYDDSYNCSPTSLAAALAVLGETRAARRVAVIGDMLELGDAAIAAHREAGQRAAATATDLIAVGDYAGVVVEASGMPSDRVRTATDAGMAAKFVAPLLDSDTVVLVKASHGLHLEQVVEALRA